MILSLTTLAAFLTTIIFSTVVKATTSSMVLMAMINFMAKKATTLFLVRKETIYLMVDLVLIQQTIRCLAVVPAELQ